MSKYVVVRTGTGPLHIAFPTPLGYEAICDKRIAGDKVITWRAGQQATAVWKLWRHCPTCERRDHEWRR